MKDSTLDNSLAPKTFYIKTYGCQMNVYDSDRISALMAEEGFVETENPQNPDMIIINTCSIREKAVHKVMTLMGHIKPVKEKNEDLIIALAGCVAQQEGEALLKKVPHLDIVFGPDNIDELPDLLHQVQAKREETQKKLRNGVVKKKFFNGRDVYTQPIPKFIKPKVSSYLSIMKGCDHFCTYCIVPFVRGREKSRPISEIVQEAKQMVALGVKDITLLGQNVNNYGKNTDSQLPQLLRELHDIEGLERIRMTTSHPVNFTFELMDCFGNLPKVVNHLHFPFQSGSNKILEAMRREYPIEVYLEKVNYLKKVCPDIAFGTDIIVGFPGETEEDFRETMRVVREVEYDSAFSFIYSPRKFTKAKDYEDQVPADVAKQRLYELQNLINEITLKKNVALVGNLQEVLVEGNSTYERLVAAGRTRTNKIVNFTKPDGKPFTPAEIRLLKGQMLSVKITHATASSLRGEWAGEEKLSLADLESKAAELQQQALTADSNDNLDLNMPSWCET